MCDAERLWNSLLPFWSPNSIIFSASVSESPVGLDINLLPWIDFMDFPCLKNHFPAFLTFRQLLKRFANTSKSGLL